MNASWNLQKSENIRFSRATWKQVGTKIEAEINVIFERRFLEKSLFSCGKAYFFEIQGVEVGSKNRSKIDVKSDAETEGLGNSIFIDFWWIWEPSWPSKTEPRRSKIDVEKASKFDQFLKGSWNATFSAQEPPRGARQEPLRRRIRKEDGRKDSETSYPYPTRRPRRAAD